MMSMPSRGVLVRLATAAVLCAAVLAPTTSARATSHSNAIKRGGTMTVVWGPKGSWTRDFNPYSGNASDGTLELIYEPLVMFNDMKGGKVVYWLAKSYKWGTGLKTLTFNLRSGVKWNDGKPFTSADVKFSFNLAKNNPGIACGDCWKALSSVSTPNATTVVFNFKTVNSTMLYYLGRFDIVPQHVWSKVGDPVKDTNPSPVGTGPYKLGSFSSQVYTLVRNTYYWQTGKPYVDTLRFPAFTGNDSAQLAAIKGQIDWAGLFIPDPGKTYTSKSKDNHIFYQGVGGPVSIWLNDAEAPFTNVHVRRAIALAIDRTTISKAAEYGYAPAGNAAFVQPQLIKRWGNSSALKVLPAGASVSKAKTELAKAKGVNLSKTYTINVVAGWTDWNTAVQLASDELKAIGVHTAIEPLQFGDYLSHLQQGKFDLAISWMGAGPSPFFVYRDDFTKDAIPPPGQAAGSNFSRYSNPKLDSLINAYTHTGTASKQVAIMKQAEGIVASDMPIVPLFAAGDLWDDYSTKHFVGWPDPKSPYNIGSPYNHPSNLDVILHVHLK